MHCCVCSMGSSCSSSLPFSICSFLQVAYLTKGLSASFCVSGSSKNSLIAVSQRALNEFPPSVVLKDDVLEKEYVDMFILASSFDFTVPFSRRMSRKECKSFSLLVEYGCIG